MPRSNNFVDMIKISKVDDAYISHISPQDLTAQAATISYLAVRLHERCGDT